MPILFTALAAFAGAASWTLLEYGMHRFLGHDRRTFPNPFASEHTRHHGEGDYFAPTWKKAAVALAAFGAVGALASAVAGSTLGLVFAGSFVKMYVAYEVIHRRAHTHPGFGPYARYLRRHHFHHHFVNPHANHGVTTPIWDLVFGTLEAPGRIPVPESLKMRWLVDPATSEVRPEHRARYELLRRMSSPPGASGAAARAATVRQAMATRITAPPASAQRPGRS
jgi:sterol desaturase/sphingolipid hydroxylase (fatty acid hydroxylase superfamily)